MNILVTGANGFIGRRLCRALAAAGHSVRGAVRRPDRALPGVNVDWVTVGDIGPDTGWRPALEGIDAVVHLAARVHVLDETARDPLAAFRQVNVTGTAHLARTAAACGVRRLVHMSSIKVNGETTGPACGFTETDAPRPAEPYGISKWEAEQTLRRVEAETTLEVVVVRPPLVYGPGVGGNFRRLMHWVRRGVPLPFANVPNRRSLVGIDNLVDFVQCCLTHEAAAGATFVICDGEDLSTPELIRRLAHAMHRPARLFPLPFAPALAARMPRLYGSLVVDAGKARRVLGWSPVCAVDAGLAQTVQAYLAGKEAAP
ncbi:MAG: SDR family oxidoreductase [Anaerolineae bacterium]|nr:SDR family oxidoreductase [Anaerolineae bacterium]